MTAEEGSTELVGRDLVVEAVAESLRTGVGGAAIYGDVGMGKSALVDVLVRRFEAEMLVFHLRASAALASIPYGALSQFVRGLDEQELNSPLIVLRRLKGHFQNLEEEDGRPVLLIVDDAHELDESSSHVLEQLLMAEVIRLVVLGRNHGPGQEGVFVLSRDGLLATFELVPLSEDEVKQYCEREVRGPLAAGTVALFSACSAGNPYVLKAMVSHGLRTGQLERHDGIWLAASRADYVDPFLTNMIKELLQRCTPLEWNLLQTVSLLEPAPLSVLVRMLDSETLYRLLECGVLQLASSGDESVSVRYPLFSEIARRGVPVGRSREIRDQALQLMGRALPDAIGLVRWVGWALDIGLAVEDAELLHAARLANNAYNSKAALRFTAAVNGSGNRSAALMHSAFAHLCNDDLDEALAEAEAAMASVADLEILDEAAMVAAGIALHSGRAGTAVGVVADAWANCRTRLAPGSPGAAVTGTLLHVYSRHLSGQHEQSLEELTELVESESGTPKERLFALIMLAEALDATGRAESGAALAAGASVLLQEEQDLASLYPLAIFRFAVTLLHAGRHADAIQFIDECILNAPPRYVFYGGEAPALQGIALVWNGRVREGLNLLAGGIAQLRKRDLVLMLPYALGHAAFASMLLGEPERVRVYAADFEAILSPGPEPEALSAHGYIAAARAGLNRPDHPDILALADQARRGGMRAAEKELLEILTLLGGSKHLPRLTELAQTTEGDEGTVMQFIAGALTNGDPVQMVEAAARADARGQPLLAAECLTRAAHQYGAQEKHRAQRAVLQQLKRHPAALPKVRSDLRNKSAISLTSRENEIVRLVLAGLTNSKIAERLVVSTRTVEGHLYRIYMKLGISRRDELSQDHLEV